MADDTSTEGAATIKPQEPEESSFSEEKPETHEESHEEGAEERTEETPEEGTEEPETHEEHAEEDKGEHKEEPEKKAEEKKPKKEEEKQPSPEKMTPYALRKFLRQLILISKKQEIKVKAHDELKKHLQKLKEMPADKLDPKKLKNVFDSLNRKLYTVIDAERDLAAVGREDPEIIKMFKEEIIQLKDKLRSVEEEKNKYAYQHKRLLTGIHENLSEAKKKLDESKKKREDRERKVRELEEKIKATPVRKHEIIAAKKQLEKLEMKYGQLSKKGRKKEKLQELKARIDDLKEKLAAEI